VKSHAQRPGSHHLVGSGHLSSRMCFASSTGADLERSACSTETWVWGWPPSLFSFFFFFFTVLGFELRAYTLSHSTSPFL
jgi:hypothetical protein